MALEIRIARSLLRVEVSRLKLKLSQEFGQTVLFHTNQ
jgi:hypothetical protein